MGALFLFAFIAAAATFFVGFYLCLFGLPVALLLGDRIRHPFALLIALVDAAISAVIVGGGSRFGLFEIDTLASLLFALVLAFALPAGYFYHRNVIAMRDTLEFL